MCDHGMLIEYGLVGAFDSCCMMLGENVAIISNTPVSSGTEQVLTAIKDEDDFESKSSSMCSYSDLIGISYLELQYSSESLAAQLYHRLGVRSNDRTLLLCKGHAAAEIVSCLACARLGASFVPIDESWLGTKRFSDIMTDSEPVAAVVVGENDSDEIVLFLSQCGLFRCALLGPNGYPVFLESSNDDLRGDLPPCPHMQSESLRCIEDSLGVSIPLYIMYTSGSTGRPKGVCGTHHGLMHRLSWQFKTFPWQRSEVACRKTPLVFVDSIAEMFAPLLGGVPIWAPPSEAYRSRGIAGITTEAAAAGITRLTLLPSQLLRALRIETQLGQLLPTLKYVTISGEACPTHLIRAFANAVPHATLINLYGSTELAGDVTCAVLYKSQPKPAVCSDDQDSDCSNDQEANIDGLWAQYDVSNSVFACTDSLLSPIGFPIGENAALVVRTSSAVAAPDFSGDASVPLFELVSVGEPGELLVVGTHVALGYHNNPHETASRFLSIAALSAKMVAMVTGEGVQDNTMEVMKLDAGVSVASGDYSVRAKSDAESDAGLQVKEGLHTSGIKVFRTGDIVVQDARSGGALRWLGRRDLQVKIRGVRVEIEEVEASVGALLEAIEGVAIVAAALHSMRQTTQGESNSSSINSPSITITEGTHQESEEEFGVVQIDETSELSLVLFVEEEALHSWHMAFIQAIRSEEPQLQHEQYHEHHQHKMQLNEQQQGGTIINVPIPPAVTSESIASSRRLHAELHRRLPPTFVPTIILTVAALPRNSSGKVDRPLLSGSLQELISASLALIGRRDALPAAPSSRFESPREACAEMADGSFVERDCGEKVVASAAKRRREDDNALGSAALSSTDSKDSGLADLNENDSSNLTTAEAVLSLARLLSEVLPAFVLHTAPELREYLLLRADSITSGVQAFRHIRSSTGMVDSNSFASSWTSHAAAGSREEGSLKNFESLSSSSLAASKAKTIVKQFYETFAEATFYSLGGDSVSAIELLWRLQLLTGRTIPLAQLGQTLESLIQLITDPLSPSGTKGFLNASQPSLDSHSTQIMDANSRAQFLEAAPTVSMLADDAGLQPGQQSDSRNMAAICLIPTLASILHDSVLVAWFGRAGSGSESAESISGPSHSRPTPPPVSLRSAGESTPSQPTTFVSENMTTLNGALSAKLGEEAEPASTMIELRPMWKRQLLKCVDSPPLVVRFCQMHPTVAETSAAATSAAPGFQSNALSAATSDYFSGDPYLETGKIAAAPISATRHASLAVQPETATETNSTQSEQRTTRDIVYIGSHGGDFVALEAASGALIWVAHLGGHFEGGAVCSADGHTIVAPAYAGDDVDGHMSRKRSDGCLGTLWALDAADGFVRWERGVSGELKGTPVVEAHRNWVFAGSYDGWLYAFSCEDGSAVGRIFCGSPIFATPALSLSASSCEYEFRVYVATRGGILISIDVGGGSAANNSAEGVASVESSWLRPEVEAAVGSSKGDECQLEDVVVGKVEGFECINSKVLRTYEAEAPMFATPVIVGINTIPANQSADAFSAPQQWPRDAPREGISGERVIIAAVDGTVRCVDSSGRLVWVAYATRPIFSSPCLLTLLLRGVNRSGTEVGNEAGSASYGGDGGCGSDDEADKNIEAEGCVVSRKLHGDSHFADEMQQVVVFGSHDSMLRCVRCSDGSLVWEEDMGAAVFASPTIATVSSLSLESIRVIADTSSSDCRRSTKVDGGTKPELDDCSSKQLIVAATTAGDVILVDCESGQILSGPITSDSGSSVMVAANGARWRQRLPAEIYSSPVATGSAVFIGCRDDRLHCFHLLQR